MAVKAVVRSYRALRVWPWGGEPVRAEPTTSAGGAYSSSLTLTFDPEPPA